MGVSIDAIDIGTVHDDFSGGLVSGLAQVGLGSGRRKTPIRHVRRCDNVVFRPRRGAGVRRGSTDISAAVLPLPPTSLGKYYVTGANKLFTATDDGLGGGKVYLSSPSAYTEQTLPFTATEKGWTFEMFNGVLIGCQWAGNQPPIFFKATNPANTWHSIVLPAPAAAPTFGTDQAGGSLTVTKDYFYRVRWRYENGSSKTGPVSAAKQVIAASGNYTIRVTIPVPGSPRSDYVGWTLERTKITGDALGPFYAVADGTAASYDDGKSDAGLHSRSIEVLHGEPPHFEGVIGHKGRLFGWTASLLYVSQPITGAEATGIFNWQADAIYPVQKDDGDAIQTVKIQGDRLVILKTRSIHVLEGDDPDNFRLRAIYQGVGAAGPRAADTTGLTVWFYSGNRQLNLLDGDRWKPIADDELRDYLGVQDVTQDRSVIVRNLLGDFVLMFYAATPSAYNEDIVAFDLRQRNWTHFTGWRATDVLVQKDDSDFGRATLLLADPKLLSPTGAAVLAGNPTYVAWEDGRSATSQIYANKILSDGSLQWGAGGVQVGANVTSLGTGVPRVLSDGGDGSIVVFTESRSGTMGIFAQHLNSAGTRTWNGSSGTTVCDQANNETDPVAVPDGSGGAYVAWIDARSGSHVYAQRLDSTGAVVWAANGVSVSGATAGTKSKPVILRDASGALYVGFANNPTSTETTWVQKLNPATGASLWTAGGVTCGASALYSNHRGIAMCLDGVGGLFVLIGPTTSSIVVKRINSAGAVAWTSGNLDTTTFHAGSVLLPDASGGCIAVWSAGSVGTAQLKGARVSAAGAIVWGAPAINLSGLDGASTPMLTCVQDGAGGVIAVWGISATLRDEVYAQRLDANGARLWGGGTNALQVFAGIVNQSTNPECCTDANGGCWLTWQHGSPSSSADVFFQHIGPGGLEAFAHGGLSLVALSNLQGDCQVNFTNTPTGLSGGGVPGYHVWSAMNGFKDERDVNGNGGNSIDYALESPFTDEGFPDQDKDLEWIEAYVEKGDATVVATILLDNGDAVTVPLQAVSNAPRYDAGYLFDNGVLYADPGKLTIGSGLPKGTIGRSYAVRIAAKTDSEFVLGGYATRGFMLPTQRY